MIQVGQNVPDFSINDENGEVVSSKNLLGHRYILFFYPQDDSPSCTKEACSVRDHYSAISKLGYKIFGVSPDNEKKHKKFISKYEFQYPLLADSEKEMINAFGLFGPKKFMGKEVMGVYRTTVIIDENGIIINIIDQVKTAEHGQQILEVIKK
jgi:peroxiredoxin Q/BCP